jgi:uncharacterized protein (UPF0371 family)
MPRPIGFDNEKYLKEQSAAILERVNSFHNKLYLEFGGKLLYDFHAARVLPGFDPNVKMRLLQQLKDKTDVRPGLFQPVPVCRLARIKSISI